MWKIYPFNNYFDGHPNKLNTKQRFEILKDLGYNAFHMTLLRGIKSSWDEFLECPKLAQRTGIEFPGIYTVVSLLDPIEDHPVDEVIEHMPAGSTLEIGFHAGWQKDLSDPRHDQQILDMLGPWLEKASQKNVIISLYPHTNFALETLNDAHRIINSLQHPALGLTFSLYHWQCTDGKNLSSATKKADPHLFNVNLNGYRPKNKPSVHEMPYTIETLEGGIAPIETFLAELGKIGYDGYIGFQGYGLQGDARELLIRSKRAYHQTMGNILSQT